MLSEIQTSQVLALILPDKKVLKMLARGRRSFQIPFKNVNYDNLICFFSYIDSSIFIKLPPSPSNSPEMSSLTLVYFNVIHIPLIRGLPHVDSPFVASHVSMFTAEHVSHRIRVPVETRVNILD